MDGILTFIVQLRNFRKGDLLTSVQINSRYIFRVAKVSTGSFRKNEKLYMLITKGWGALSEL
jgi:hypothetical protein